MTNEQIVNELIECGRSLAKLHERMDAAFKRIDEQKKMSDSLHILALSVERQTAKLEQQSKDIAALRGDVDEMKEKPSKRWELIITGVISAAVAAVMSVITAYLMKPF